MSYILFSQRKEISKVIKEKLNYDINENDIVNVLTVLQEIGLLNVKKCDFNKEDICVNADSENLADYCKGYCGKYKKGR